jgi:hypothetical protein
MGTDVISVSPFCIVGRQMPHLRQADDDNDGKSFLPPAVERRTDLRVTQALARRRCRTTRLILRRRVGCLKPSVFSILVRGKLPLRGIADVLLFVPFENPPPRPNRLLSLHLFR